MKALAVLVTILILSGTGGVAYAWSNGGGTGCGGNSDEGCQTYGVFWSTPGQATPSASSVKCTISIDPDSDNLIEGAGNLGPGQSCSFSAVLTNTGALTVTITEPGWTGWAWQPRDCKFFTYSDNVRVPPYSPLNSIEGGRSFAYQGALSLSNSASNACEGAFAFFHVVIIAFPLERCSSDR